MRGVIIFFKSLRKLDRREVISDEGGGGGGYVSRHWNTVASRRSLMMLLG